MTEATHYVYIKKGSDEYHNKECLATTSGFERIEIEEALEEGYTPCPGCYWDGD